MHPHPAENDKRRWAKTFKHALGVLKLAAAILPLWPMPGFEFSRPPRREKTATDLAERVPQDKLHQWINGPNGWTCRICRSTCRIGQLQNHRARQRCPGLDDRLAAFASSPLGHRVVEMSHHMGDFSICADCGRWGTRSAKGLSKPCTGAPTTVRTAASWRAVFQRGAHPNPRTATKLRTHADGLKVAKERTPFLKLRGTLTREVRSRRLRGKHKPWAAAASGYVPANGPLVIPMADTCEHFDLFEDALDDVRMRQTDELCDGNEFWDVEDVDVFGYTGMGLDDGEDQPIQPAPASQPASRPPSSASEYTQADLPSSNLRSPAVVEQVDLCINGCQAGVSCGASGGLHSGGDSSSSSNAAKRPADDDPRAAEADASSSGAPGANGESFSESLLRKWRGWKTRRLSA